MDVVDGPVFVIVDVGVFLKTLSRTTRGPKNGFSPRMMYAGDENVTRPADVCADTSALPIPVSVVLATAVHVRVGVPTAEYVTVPTACAARGPTEAMLLKVTVAVVPAVERTAVPGAENVHVPTACCGPKGTE